MPSIADNHDRLYMAQALELARRGIGLTSPNPNVGAVIVDASGENVIGRGIHTYDGTLHAEIHALNEAAFQTSTEACLSFHLKEAHAKPPRTIVADTQRHKRSA